MGRVEANEDFFRRALKAIPERFATPRISSVFEFGAGTGENLMALKRLMPDVKVYGTEINASARAQAKRNGVPLGDWSIVGGSPASPSQMGLSKGLLIHIHPSDLPDAYQALYNCGRRYILLAEYFNPTPVAMLYRGHRDRLWKRDFAGEMLNRFTDLRLLDYGFVYHRDWWPQDDLHWFLMVKS